MVLKDRTASLSKQTVFTVGLVSEACGTILDVLKSMRNYDLVSNERFRKKLLCKNVLKIQIVPKKQLDYSDF